ncbi:hypothetical protein [Nocardia bhagyanarayanae]|uniref:hypothetical protein n=1 Tax=Nocardia bhagyanarayanae TaxID=1215925 RepID=UPI001152AACF|nr:hypothetical protein [Nocardia bhagyanarayanae]
MKVSQSVEELESLATSIKPRQHRHNGLLAAARRAEGIPFTRVEQAYCLTSPAAMAGIVGKIRTTLVEMVADMTRDVPFDGLPPRNQVDSAVQVNLHGSRDQYHIKVGTNSGVIGQGPGSSQTQHVTNTGQELADLLERLRTAVAEIGDDDDRADAARTVDDFEEAVCQDNPEPEAVRSRWRALQRMGAVFGGAFGGAVASETASAVVGAITSAM